MESTTPAGSSGQPLMVYHNSTSNSHTTHPNKPSGQRLITKSYLITKTPIAHNFLSRLPRLLRTRKTHPSSRVSVEPNCRPIAKTYSRVRSFFSPPEDVFYDRRLRDLRLRAGYDVRAMTERNVLFSNEFRLTRAWNDNRSIVAFTRHIYTLMDLLTIRD